MPTLKYALESGGPKRLEIAYSLGIRSATIRLDGREVGMVESRKALNEGRDFDLPDGSTLTLHLFRNGLATQMRVLRDGIPVPGSASDPLVAIKNAYTVLFFIAAANIIIGLGTALLHVEFSTR